MSTVPLAPAYFRARFTAGPDVYVVACHVREVREVARELELESRDRGALVGIDVLAGGRWEPCPCAPVLRFAV